MKSLLRCTFFSFFFFGVIGVGFGQDFKCGTPERTKKEVQEMQNFYKNFALQNLNSPSITTQYIYIKFHNVRRTTADRDISSSISTIISTLNTKFIPLNIEFIPLGGVNNIFSSVYYDLDLSEESALRASNDYTNALNMYFVGNPNGVSGYARYPTLNGYKFTNAIFVQTNVNNTLFNDFVIAQTIPHEVGHYFNLIHTFGDIEGIQTSELVNGSNCSYTGDEVCDTPADPYIDRNWYSTCVQSPCTWNCTNTDINGQRYNPSMNNFMSYYQYCRNRFTSGQYYRMSGGLNLRNNVSSTLSQRYYLDGLNRTILQFSSGSSSLACSGDNLTMQFNSYGEPSFCQGTFYLQMKPINNYYFGVISSNTGVSAVNGQVQITGTIPSNTPAGYYKVRIAKGSSTISESGIIEQTIYINGTTNGTPTGSSIASQYALATTTLYNATSTCAGRSIALYANVNGYDSYWWTKDGLNFTASSTNSYLNASSTGNYTLNMTKCGNVYRSSNSIYLNFYNPASNVIASANGASTNFRLTTCEGSVVSLSSGCQSGMNTLWNDGITSSIRYINASSTRDYMVNCNNYFCNVGYSPPVRIIALNQNVQSTKTGNWQDPTVWTSNIIPLNCQTVTVQSGHTVNVPVTDAKAKNIIIRGNLNFQNPTPSTKGKVGLGGN